VAIEPAEHERAAMLAARMGLTDLAQGGRAVARRAAARRDRARGCLRPL
jgi:hypothetical protein